MSFTLLNILYLSDKGPPIELINKSARITSLYCKLKIYVIKNSLLEGNWGGITLLNKTHIFTSYNQAIPL